MIMIKETVLAKILSLFNICKQIEVLTVPMLKFQFSHSEFEMLHDFYVTWMCKWLSQFKKPLKLNSIFFLKKSQSYLMTF